MLFGILFALAACFCWSLVFVVPTFLDSFHPIEIALGRFFVYGLICFSLLLLTRRHLICKSQWKNWKKALFFALFSTIVCYTGTVCNMEYAGPTVATLLFAMSPISISLAGNWHKKEIPFKKLLFPILLMLIGILLTKYKVTEVSNTSPLLSIVGIFLGLIGLASWTWFAVVNSDFLKQNKDLSVSDWALMMGSSTFFYVIVIASLLLIFFPSYEKYFSFSPEVENFVIGSFVMGTISTWLAFLLWNHGAKRIPVSLAGQLMISEIIFALFLIYLLEKRVPSVIELTGICFMICGVMIGFHQLKITSIEESS